MKYVYRNKNTEGVVELTKPRPEFEESDNWERIEGELPEAPDAAGLEVEAEDGQLTTEEVVHLVCDNLEGFEDEQIERLYAEISSEAQEREAVKAAAEKKEDPAEVDATDSAKALAEEEGIDLSTVTGTGEEGRITLTDVREAVKAAAEK